MTYQETFRGGKPRRPGWPSAPGEHWGVSRILAYGWTAARVKAKFAGTIL